MTDHPPKNKPRRNNRTKDINKRAAHHHHHDTTTTLSPPLSSSPISSLNSSLSKKLGRLDSPSRGHHPSHRNSDRLDRDRGEDDGNYKGRPTNFNSRSNPNFHRDAATTTEEEEEYYLNDVTDYDSPRSRSQMRHHHRGMRRGAAKVEYEEDNHDDDDDVRLIRTKSRSRSRQHRNKRDEKLMDDDYYEDELPKSRSRNSLYEDDAKRGSLYNQKSRGSRSNNNSLHYELEEEYHENATRRRRSLPKSRGRSNNRKSSSFHYEEDDEYLTPVNDARIKPHKSSRSHSNIDELRQKEPSSLHRGAMHSNRSRNNNSFHDQLQQQEEEDDDYLVGEEVHVKQPHSRVTRRNNNSYTTLYDDDSDSVRDTWSMAKCKLYLLDLCV
jgi:hypothetical protein